MGKRKSAKARLFLSAKRKKHASNIAIYHMNKNKGNETSSSQQENDEESISIHPEFPESLATTSHQELFHGENEPSGSKTHSTSGETGEFDNSSLGSNILEGRRFAEFFYVFNSLKEFDGTGHYPGFDCSLKNMNIIKENRIGFLSVFYIKCNMCNATQKLETSDRSNSNQMDINTSAVNGIMLIGSGYSHLEELCTALMIPCMEQRTYNKLHSKICDGLEKVALQKMAEAAEAEKDLAIAEGNVGSDGVPEITVVCDGSWAKRSYRTNYNSLSGTAAIVGFQTKKVIFMGVKNKYCTICKRAENRSEAPRAHTCYKNWSGSSSSMESAIICEGFLKSEEMYGLRYTKMIADGDASTYKKIVEARPYRNTPVEKIECRNHLLRNYCTKLNELSSNARAGSLRLRRKIKGHILKLRCAITKAIAFRKAENGDRHIKSLNLQQDILNSVSHVFGEHKKCVERGYFCQKDKPDDINVIPDLIADGLYEKIMDNVRYVANHSRSLIYDVDSNVVEQFNSIVCKFIGGKRINYTQRRSYQGRVSAAVISHNTKRPLYHIHKYYTNTSPTSRLFKRYEARRKYAAKRKVNAPRNFQLSKKSGQHQINDIGYGSHCQKPDMSAVEFDINKELYLKSLHKTDDERKALEIRTRGQSGSIEWKEERRKILTASNFGLVCRRKATTSCKKLVTMLLYGATFSSQATEYGKRNEPRALEELILNKNLVIEKCGLFVDIELQFLGATPDGIVGSTGLVEIKCPYSAREMTPEEGIEKKLITFWKLVDGDYCINKIHKWYYQVQGQLNITNRQYCLLAVWTPLGMKVESIEVDKVFWENKMKPKLTQFYINCILPELVDPRKVRNMEIRDPEYILMEQEKHKKRVHLPC